MTGLIEKIDELKVSASGDVSYIRVYFKLLDPDNKGEFIWSKTDVVPTFRNYKRWEKYLVVGNVLAHLSMKDDKTVDADSRFVFQGNIYEDKPE